MTDLSCAGMTDLSCAGWTELFAPGAVSVVCANRALEVEGGGGAEELH